MENFFLSKHCPDIAPHDNAVRAQLNAAYKPHSFNGAEWVAKHPQAYKAFCKYALEAIQSGWRHFGAKAVAERVRWEAMLEKRDDYKMNNNAVSYMARRFMQEHPQHAGFFQTRNKGE